MNSLEVSRVQIHSYILLCLHKKKTISKIRRMFQVIWTRTWTLYRLMLCRYFIVITVEWNVTRAAFAVICWGATVDWDNCYLLTSIRSKPIPAPICRLAVCWENSRQSKYPNSIINEMLRQHWNYSFALQRMFLTYWGPFNMVNYGNGEWPVRERPLVRPQFVYRLDGELWEMLFLLYLVDIISEHSFYNTNAIFVLWIHHLPIRTLIRS